MIKKFYSVFAFFIAFFLVSSIANAYSVPQKIKIIKESGITVRNTINSASEKLDVVYYNYVYDVVDVNVMYYKVKNEVGVDGWIYNNSLENWVEELGDGDKVRVVLPSGITMRSEPYNKRSGIVGLVEPDEIYKVLDVRFSHFKIKTPNTAGGWIYAGRFNDLWVEEVGVK